MTVPRHDRRNRTRDIGGEQPIAAALTHWVEIVLAGFLQNVLQRTRCGTRFGLLFQDFRELKSIAIGNITSI